MKNILLIVMVTLGTASMTGCDALQSMFGGGSTTCTPADGAATIGDAASISCS